MSDFNQWKRECLQSQLPRYESLPEIPLYLDQVVDYINSQLKVILNESIITKAMINNYVKHKIMPAPNKRRYSNIHIAYIMSISLLKLVMSMDDISKGIERALMQMEVSEAYNYLVENIEYSLKSALGYLIEDKVITKLYIDDEDILLPLRAVSLALSAKLIADQSFENMIKKITI